MRTHIRLLSVFLLLLTFPSTTILANTDTDTIKMLKSSLKSKEKLIEDLIDEKDALSQQLEIQRAEKEQFEIELTQLQKDIKELNAASRTGDGDVENLRLQKESLLRQLNKVRQEKVKLEDTISKMNRSLNVKDANVDSQIEEATATLKSRIQELKLQLISLEEDIEDANRKQASLQNEITKLKEGKESLKKDIELRDNNIRTLKRQLVNKIKEVRKPLQQKLEQANAALAVSNNVVRDKQTEVSDLNKKYEMTLGNIRDLKIQLDNKDLQIEELNNKIKSIQTQTSETISSISDQAKKDLEAQRDKVRDENKKLLEKISALTEDKKSLEEKISDKENSVRTIRRDRRTLQEKLDQSIERNNELVTKTAQLQNDIKALEDSFGEKISEAKQPLLGEIKKLEDNIETLSRHMDNKHDKIDQILEENKRLKTELDETVKIKNDYSKDNALLKTQLKLNTDKVSGQISSIKRPLEESIQALEKELKLLQKTSADKGQDIKSLEEEKSKLTTNVNRLSKENLDLTQKVKELELTLRDEKKLSVANTQELENALQEKIKALKKESYTLTETLKDKTTASLNLTEQNKSLTQEVTSLKKEKTAALQNLDRIEAQYSEIKATLDNRIKTATEALTAEIQQLTGQLNEAQAGMENTENQIVRLKEEKESLLGKLSSEENLRRQLENKLDELKKQLTSIQKELPKKINVVQEPLEDRIQELESKLNALNRQIEEQKETISGLSAEKSQLQNNLSKTESAKDTIEKELREIKNKFEGLNSALPQKISKAELPLKTEIHTANKRITELKKIIANLSSEQSLLQIDFKRTETEKLVIEEELRNVRAQLKRLEDTLPQKVSQAEQPLKVELSAAKEKSEAQQEAIEKLTADQSALRNSLRKTETAKDIIEQELRKIRSQYKRLNETLPQKISSVEQPLKVELNAAKKRIEAQKETIANLSAQKTSLEQDLTKTESAKGVIEQELRTLQNQFSGLKETLPEKISQAEQALKSELDTTKKRITEQKESIENLSAQKSMLQDDLTKTETAKRVIEQELRKLRNQVNGLKSSLSQKISQAEQPLKNQLNSANKKISDQQQTISMLRSEKSALKNDLNKTETEKGFIEVELKQLQSKFQGLNAKLPQVVSKAEQPLKDQLNLANKKIVELKQVITKLSSDQSLFQNDLQKMEQEKQLVEKELLQVKNKLTGLNNALPQKVSSAQKPLKDEIANLEGQLSDTEKLLKAKEGKIDELLEEKQILDNKITVLRTNNSKLASDMKILRQELTELNDSIPLKIESAKTPYETDLSKLKSQLQDVNNTVLKKDKEIKTLTREHEYLKEQIADKEKIITALEQDVRTYKDDILSQQNALTSKITQEKIPLEAEISQLKTDRQQAELKIEEHTVLIKTLNEKLEKSNRKAEETAKSKIELQERLAKINQEFDSYKKTVANKIQNVREPLEDTIATLNKKITAIENAIQSKQTTINKLTKDNETLVRQFEDIKKTKNVISLDLLNMQKEYDALKVSIPQKLITAKMPLEEEIEQLKERLKESSLSVKIAQKELNQTTRQNKDLQINLSQTKSTADKLDQEIKELQTALKNSKNEMPAIISEAIAPLQNKIAALEEDVSLSKNQLKSREETIANLQEEMRSLNTELTRTQTEKTNLASENTALTEEIQALKATIPQEVMKVQEPLEETINSLRAELKTAQDKLSAKNSNLNKIIKEKEAVKDNLNQQQKSQATLLKEVEDLQNTITNLKKSLPDEIDQAKAPLLTEMNKLQQKLSQSNSTISHKTDEISALKREQQMLTGQIKNLTREKTELTRQTADILERVKQAELKVPQKIQEVEKPLSDKIQELTERLQQTESLINVKDEALDILTQDKNSLRQS